MEDYQALPKINFDPRAFKYPLPDELKNEPSSRVMRTTLQRRHAMQRNYDQKVLEQKDVVKLRNQITAAGFNSAQIGLNIKYDRKFPNQKEWITKLSQRSTRKKSKGDFLNISGYEIPTDANDAFFTIMGKLGLLVTEPKDNTNTGPLEISMSPQFALTNHTLKDCRDLSNPDQLSNYHFSLQVAVEELNESTFMESIKAIKKQVLSINETSQGSNDFQLGLCLDATNFDQPAPINPSTIWQTASELSKYMNAPITGIKLAVGDNTQGQMLDARNEELLKAVRDASAYPKILIEPTKILAETEFTNPEAEEMLKDSLLVIAGSLLA